MSDTVALIDAADENLAAHVSWIHQRTPGMRAALAPDLVVVDSGLPQDTFNVVCRARLAPRAAAARAQAIVAAFAAAGRPFSWWVTPGSCPSGLGAALRAAGLEPADGELAMAADLAAVPARLELPPGLEIQRVRAAGQLRDFAGIIAASMAPPDPVVLDFYRLAEAALLQPEAALWLYVGYLDGRPVATAQLSVGGGVAGLYNIITLEPYRRRGIGSALTLRPLHDARAAGLPMAVLQATELGAQVYRRIGFAAFGEITEYKPG